jgi:hypothetical protein
MAVPSRRQVLRDFLAIPAVSGLAAADATFSCEILQNRDLLSEEAARGYCRLLASGGSPTRPRSLVIVAGYRDPSHALVSKLRKSAEEGSWLVWESPASFTPEESGAMSLQTLGIRTLPTRTVTITKSLYVQYCWPRTALVRTFASITPVDAQSFDQLIGFYDGQPVGAIRRVGRGGVVFLGSMLGPHLQAGDPEAERFCRHLLTSLAATSL